jgi:hypothetical protein
MTIWQRIAASLVSTLLALAITIVGFDILVLPHDPKALLAVIVAMFLLGLRICWVGWLVALPPVLIIRRTDGWRLWAALALGSAIGPVNVFLVAVYQGLKSSSLSQSILVMLSSAWLIGSAASVSLLTTVFYLFYVRRAFRITGPERQGSMTGQLAVPEDFDRMHDEEIERLFDGRPDS